MKKLAQIKEIAKCDEKGFTIRLEDLKAIKHGWCVAFKEIQNSFGDEGLKKVVEFAEKTTGIIGGWFDEGRYYFDAVMIVEDKETAIKLGKANEQMAIFNLETGAYIDLRE